MINFVDHSCAFISVSCAGRNMTCRWHVYILWAMVENVAVFNKLLECFPTAFSKLITYQYKIRWCHLRFSSTGLQLRNLTLSKVDVCGCCLGIFPKGKCVTLEGCFIVKKLRSFSDRNKKDLKLIVHTS